jgi:hypothetical protein
MENVDIAILIVTALAGFFIISYFFDRVKARPEKRNSSSPDTWTPYVGYSISKSWWIVLDIHPDAAWTEIQAAYDHKMQHYDASLIARLEPCIRVLAEIRLKEINRAFEEAKKVFAQGQRVVFND